MSSTFDKMRADLGILDIEYALPETVVSSGDIAARHDFDIGFIEDKLGIRERGIAGEAETTATLAISAVEKLINRTGIAKPDIGLLVLVTQTPDHLLPHSSALIHQAIGLEQNCAVFDISLGCSGWVYGLAVVLGMMRTQDISHAVLVTADTYSRLMDSGDRATAPLFGDGAAATLIGPQPLYHAGQFTFGSDGSRHESLIARCTGAHPGKSEALFMDGRQIFNFMMTEMPQDISSCLEKNGLSKGDIDKWIFHQASNYMLETLAKRIDIPQEKVVINLRDTGNTTSSTIPIALCREILRATDRPKRIFASGFGVGLSWSSVVLMRNG